MQTTLNRTEWVDYAKGIGILLVVYGHIARGLQNAGITMEESMFSLIDSVIYSFHMPLFFFLSGIFFLQSLDKRGPAGNIANKFDTVFYPYMIWSLLQGLLEAGMAHYTNGHVSVSEVASLLWHPRAQFWFLYALFMMMVLGSVLYYRAGRNWLSALMLVFLLLYACSPVLPRVEALELVYQNFVYFALGVWFSRCDASRLQQRSWLVVWALLFVTGQWLYHGYLDLNAGQKGLTLAALAMVSIFFVVAVSMELARYQPQWLQAIGYASLAIYLMHVIVGAGVRVILQKLLHIDNYIMHLLFGCVLSVVIPMMAFAYMERHRMDYFFKLPRKGIHKPA